MQRCAQEFFVKNVKFSGNGLHVWTHFLLGLIWSFSASLPVKFLQEVWRADMSAVSPLLGCIKMWGWRSSKCKNCHHRVSFCCFVLIHTVTGCCGCDILRLALTCPIEKMYYMWRQLWTILKAEHQTFFLKTPAGHVWTMLPFVKTKVTNTSMVTLLKGVKTLL